MKGCNSVDGVEANRSKIVVNSSHKDNRTQLTSDFGQGRTNEYCVYHRMRASGE